MSETYTVTLQPVGIEMEVEEGETLLDAAFRQGIALPHGCKEGQCSACKCIITEGEVELKKYSTFALNDMERDSNHILLCRALAETDLEVELLNYDEELLSRSIPVGDYDGKVVGVEKLTDDIRLLEIAIDRPIKFFAGQYCDITLPGTGITRSFSMASTPDKPERLKFIIKKYPNGAFSSRLDGCLPVGAKIALRGPYGTCLRREERKGPMILVGGGSGMSPLLSILHDQLAEDPKRPIYFFYGARTQKDLFYREHFAELEQDHPDFKFIPALSDAGDDPNWKGGTGFVHEVAKSSLQQIELDDSADAYVCGPAPMIDSTFPVLMIAGVDTEHIYCDRFTPAPQIDEVESA
jgi:propane monooxygenase reductase component